MVKLGCPSCGQVFGHMAICPADEQVQKSFTKTERVKPIDEQLLECKAARDRYKAALENILKVKGLDADQLETIVDIVNEALEEGM